MKVKFFTVGDDRPLRHFISDNAIRICEVRVIGNHSSVKDFEICLVYKKDPDKTLRNNFHCFISIPVHVIEKDINRILSRDSVTNFHISPYGTKNMKGYAFFWEELTNEAERTRASFAASTDNSQ
jgi:hypothetical protein